MYKYVPLQSFLNRVPKRILDEVASTDLEAWGFQFMKDYFRRYTEETYIGVVELSNHKGKLPCSLVAFHDAFYSYTAPDERTCSEAIEEEDGVQVYGVSTVSEYFEESLPMLYIGTNKNLLMYSNVSMNCRDCNVGFSLDKKLSCIMTDMQTGYVIFLYSTVAKDCGKLLIPDLPELMQALSYYAQHQYWLNKVHHKDGGALQLSNQFLVQANAHKNKAITRDLLRSYDPEKGRELFYGSFKIGKLDSVTGNHKNRNY